jgi:hypothetical protein
MPDRNCGPQTAYFMPKPGCVANITEVILSAKSEHERAEHWKNKYEKFYRRLKFFQKIRKLSK